MNPEERMFTLRLFADEPALDAAITWARRLTKLFRFRAVESLDDVLAAPAGTLFARFAASPRRDFDAISAALVTPWTTSPVEGQISRIKMLKRTMMVGPGSICSAHGSFMPPDIAGSTKIAGEAFFNRR